MGTRGTTALRFVKKLAFRLVAVILGILVGFGIAEVGLRIVKPQRTAPALLAYDARVGSIPAPNQRGRVTFPGVFEYTFTNDAYGLRVTGIVDREKAKARVLVLGDSFTYGVGVNDDQTFSYLLEQRLSKTPLAPAVINAGNGGKGTDYALRFFETLGQTFRPDVTVLCFFANDFVDNGRSLIYTVTDDGRLLVKPSLGSVYARKERLRKSAAYNWLISWSHLANLVKQIAVGYVRPQEVGALDTEAEKRGSAHRNGWADARNTWPTKVFVEHLIEAVRHAGSVPIIFYVPGGDEVKWYRDTGRVSKDEAAFKELLGTKGEVLISLTPMLAASGRPVEALYFDEERTGRPTGHWTPLGHSLVAAFMEGVVRDRLERR